MKVLAIDPGFDRIGIAVVEKTATGKESLIFSTCIETNRKDEHYNRLLQLGTGLRSYIQEYAPDAIAIEDLFFSTNQKTALKVSEARGVLLYESRLAGLPIFEYKPNAVKIALTGYGAADKTHVSMMVRKLLGLTEEKKLDDELDAIAIGITHLVSYKMMRA